MLAEKQTNPITLSNDENWSLIIRPQRNLLDLHLGELWRARELVMLFVWRTHWSHSLPKANLNIHFTSAEGRYPICE